MDEIFFMVQEAPEGGYTARAIGHAIFTQADTVDALRDEIKDAVSCHFELERPGIIHLHFIRDEILTYA